MADESKYVWVCMETGCKACQDLDGRVYATSEKGDAKKPHENCKCKLVKVGVCRPNSTYTAGDLSVQVTGATVAKDGSYSFGVTLTNTTASELTGITVNVDVHIDGAFGQNWDVKEQDFNVGSLAPGGSHSETLTGSVGGGQVAAAVTGTVSVAASATYSKAGVPTSAQGGCYWDITKGMGGDGGSDADDGEDDGDEDEAEG